MVDKLLLVTVLKKMKKLEGILKTQKEPTIQWLDKNWVDICIKNIEEQTKGDVKNASFIAECLPNATYKRLAAIWGLDPDKIPRTSGNTCKLQNKEEESQRLDEFIRSVERDLGIRSDLSEDLQVEVGSFTEAPENKKALHKVKGNPYLKFLNKSKALECQRKGTSRLGKKVGKITKIIIKNFLEWYQSLGEHDEESIIEDTTLEELFQIGFDMPAAKALAMRIRELPTVPECLAILRNEPKHATRYGLRQYLKRDIKMENIPMKMFAFGSMLPKEKPSLRYKPPRNFVQKTWMECSRVPADLDSMKTIWEGLEKLRSTIAFSTWLNSHPEITPPAYLKKQGLLKINYEEWNQMYKGFELEVDNVESSPSEINENPSMQEVQYTESTRINFGSIDSF